MDKIKTIKHSCVICQSHEYLFEHEPPLSPHDEAAFVKSISCALCGYPISAIEFMESETGFKYDELTTRTIN
jgi:C4-type Zn-finger protein